jgi:hypothetical protein
MSDVEALIEEARRWVSRQWATVAVMDKDVTDLVESLTDALEVEKARADTLAQRYAPCTECVRCLDICDMTTRGPGETVVECVNCDACRYCDCPKSYEPGSEGHEVARRYQAQRLVDLEGNSNGK